MSTNAIAVPVQVRVRVAEVLASSLAKALILAVVGDTGARALVGALLVPASAHSPIAVVVIPFWLRSRPVATLGAVGSREGAVCTI